MSQNTKRTINGNTVFICDAKLERQLTNMRNKAISEFSRDTKKSINNAANEVVNVYKDRMKSM